MQPQISKRGIKTSENFQKYVFASQYSFVHYTVDVIFLSMTYGYCYIRNRCTPYNLNRTTLGHVILNLKFYNAWHFKSFLTIDFMQVAIDFKHVLIKKKKLWVKLLFYLFENRIAIWNLLKLSSLLKNSPSSMVFTILFHGVFCNSLIFNIWWWIFDLAQIKRIVLLCTVNFCSSVTRHFMFWILNENRFLH